MHINIEIKARCADPSRIRDTLTARQALFKGVDHQIDTYFNCAHGRLKLREGNIEHHLIHYEREDQAGPKQSNVILYTPQPQSNLKELLTKAYGVLAVVDKRREIYFLENVKFHIDQVEGLGSFAEIEAIDKEGVIGRERLLQQCEQYMALFGIREDDLLTCSYSDMILRNSSP